jgi:hypothetical protein
MVHRKASRARRPDLLVLGAVPSAAEPSLAAFLLPTYDEFLVGFAGFDEARRGGRSLRRSRSVAGAGA